MSPLVFQTLNFIASFVLVFNKLVLFFSHKTRQDEFCGKGQSNGDVVCNLDDELSECQSSLCCGHFIVQCSNRVKLYLHFLIIFCYAKDYMYVTSCQTNH